jgi:hypothetical protein
MVVLGGGRFLMSEVSLKRGSSEPETLRMEPFKAEPISDASICLFIQVFRDDLPSSNLDRQQGKGLFRVHSLSWSLMTRHFSSEKLLNSKRNQSTRVVRIGVCCTIRPFKKPPGTKLNWKSLEFGSFSDKTCVWSCETSSPKP